jgi:SAM-dependent methyltransferase
MFTSSLYTSGTSPIFVRHFEQYADAVLKQFYGAARTTYMPFVVDVGSNDGTLLKAFQKLEARVLGVEPAQNLATTCGVPTVCDFFGEGTAGQIRDNYGLADVIVANNVLAHIDDLDSVMRGVKRLLAPDGFLVFEVQYLGALLEAGAFDLIYHEHVSYHAVAPLVGFLRRHGLQLFDVDKVPTHGGSIRCWAQHIGGPYQPQPKKISELIEAEELHGVLSGIGWTRLSIRVETTRYELRTILDTFKAGRATIAAYGAPAKLTTLFYTLGITADDIDYICDDSPLKQGRYSPGMHIPIVAPSELLDSTTRGFPEAILLAAWNFREPILQKLKPLMDGGTHVIIPFPTVEVL